MSKVTESTYFDRTLYCAECGWWQQPWTRMYGFPRCCRDCGGDLESVAGKFHVRYTHRFLCPVHVDVLSFTPREPQP